MNTPIRKEQIHIYDNWINVDGIGRVRMYSNFDKSILLDWSMKFIVGSNDRIPCERSGIVDKVLTLFNK
jgi:hypothetical protein